MALAALPDDAEPAAILATLPVAIAVLVRAHAGKPPVAPDPSLATAADLLHMIAGAPVAPQRAAALDTYLATVIDNGLGNSTFAARVTASTIAEAATHASATSGVSRDSHRVQARACMTAAVIGCLIS